MSYKILEIPENLEKPYSEMSKQGAISFFDWLNQNAQSRIIELDSLIKSSGENITLDFSAESLLPLGYWLKRALRIRKKTEEEIKTLVDSVPDWLKETVKTKDKELSEESFSVVFDLAVYFSQVLIKADDRINWEMRTKASKLDADRNQLVLIGETKLVCNPIRSIEIICFGIATGKEKPEILREFFDICKDDLLGS